MLPTRSCGEPLVFHPVGSDHRSSALADAVKAVLEAHDGEVRLVAPYLGVRVVEAITRNRPFRLVTDLEACLDGGVSDELVAWLGRHLPAIRYLPNVHAKLVLSDAAALLGSANLTHSGFAERDELGCLIRDARLVSQLRDWFDALWRHADVISDDRFREFAARAQLRTAVPKGPDEGMSPQTKAPTVRQRRSLGWIAKAGDGTGPGDTPARAAPDGQPDASVSAKFRREVVDTLRKLTTSRAEAKQVMDLLAEGLAVTALPVDDERLHLDADLKRKVLHVTVGQRYVAWCRYQRRSNVFGFILADPDVARRGAEALGPGAWVQHFDRPVTPYLKVPVEDLANLPEEVRLCWHRAIRHEVTRAGKSSYLRFKQPAFYPLLQVASLREQLATEAHPGA